MLTLASGVIYGLAFPPHRLHGVSWIALVPLLLALQGGGPWRRVGLGTLWSLAAGWSVGTWMPGAVSGYFHQPLWIGAALFLVVAGLMAAPYYAAFALAYGPLARRRASRPLLVAAAWAAAELARGRLLNGTLTYVGNSPWATFGYSQAGVLPVLQIASIAGVYGVSFVLVSVNAALADVVGDAVRRRRVARASWIGLATALGCAALTWLGGTLVLRAAPERPSPDAVPVALAQGNVGADVRWASDGPLRTLETYESLTQQALVRGRPRIVFWPEAAVTFLLEQDDLYRDTLLRAVRGRGTELVLGAPRSVGADGAGPHTNSIYLVTPDGELAARYDKQQLLPFMEYFPLGVEMARRRFGRVREFTPGAPLPPLPTRAGAAGVLVCNEALLPQVAAQRMAEGAAYLVNPANDSWVPDAGFAWQQFDIAALRAIEQRAFLLRVSDSGPSGVVDPWGRVVAHTEPLTRDVLLAEVAPTSGRSIYGRVGDAFGVLCALATAIALIGSRREVARPFAPSAGVWQEQDP